MLEILATQSLVRYDTLPKNGSDEVWCMVYHTYKKIFLFQLISKMRKKTQYFNFISKKLKNHQLQRDQTENDFLSRSQKYLKKPKILG